jgi:hypothetical protein
MSQKTVQLIIGRLLTDEDCRLRFTADPLGTLVAWRDQGFELTRGEIDALARTDPQFWHDASKRLHPHLKSCSLRTK